MIVRFKYISSINYTEYMYTDFDYEFLKNLISFDTANIDFSTFTVERFV